MNCPVTVPAGFMAKGKVSVEPRGSKVVKVPLGARKKPWFPPVEPENPPVTVPAGLMALIPAVCEPGGSNSVKVPFRARRKPCDGVKSGGETGGENPPTIVPAGLMPAALLQKLRVSGLHVVPGGSNGVMVPSEVRKKLCIPNPTSPRAPE